MNIEEFIPDDRYISIRDLQDLTGLCNRKARDEISRLKKHRAILSSSKRKGYRKCKPIEQMKKCEMEAEMTELNECLAEYSHRIKDLRKSMRKLVARKKVLEKYIENN